MTGNRLPILDDALLEQIAKTLGATEEGLTHPELDRLFQSLSLNDQLPSKGKYRATKWKRLYATLVHYQAIRPTIVYEFIELAISPSRYVNEPGLFGFRKAALNELLSFAGLAVNDEGRVTRGKQARTLEAAAEIADSILTELRRRGVHPRVLDACDRELIQKNMFHGQLEACKSVCDRLRAATMESGDGAELVNTVFSLKTGIPLVAINGCDTESEKSEHKGFAELIKGALGIWRNTTAHELRLSTVMERKQVIDALTTLSFIHWKLDEAIVTRDGSRVP